MAQVVTTFPMEDKGLYVYPPADDLATQGISALTAVVL